MIRGRHFTEVARITSRICGICSIGHTLASVKATEDAVGMRVTAQTRRLRELLKHAENFDSHVLHVYFLAAPDLFGAPSVIPLVQTHEAIVSRALRLKRLSHEWGSLLGGRTTHPTTVVPGGFTRVPTDRELMELRDKITAAVPDLQATLNTILAVAAGVPAFTRPTEYVALSADEAYAVYEGDIQSLLPDGTRERYPVSAYRSVANEYVTPASTAKCARHKLDSYAVGALARFNNNFDLLHPEAKEAAAAVGLKPICANPYMNTIAQVVEIVHSAYASLDLIEELLTAGLRPEEPLPPTRGGTGFGAVEVPRGILFHEYTYDRDGVCQGGNCVIPTNQNHANIQKDFEKLVPELVIRERGEREVELALEMLVRAYDPCISCSTHLLEVEFVR
jgi:coenzyme F420-reducing hydrogenase alpha subunit